MHGYKRLLNNLQFLNIDDWMLSTLSKKHSQYLNSLYFWDLFDAYECGLCHETLAWHRLGDSVINNLRNIHLIKCKHKSKIDYDDIYQHNDLFTYYVLTKLGKKYLKITHLDSYFDSVLEDVKGISPHSIYGDYGEYQAFKYNHFRTHTLPYVELGVNVSFSLILLILTIIMIHSIGLSSLIMSGFLLFAYGLIWLNICKPTRKMVIEHLIDTQIIDSNVFTTVDNHHEVGDDAHLWHFHDESTLKFFIQFMMNNYKYHKNKSHRLLKRNETIIDRSMFTRPNTVIPHFTL